MPSSTRRRRVIKGIDQPSHGALRRHALGAAFRNSTALENFFLVGLVVVSGTALWMWQLFTTLGSLDDGRGGGSSESLPEVLEPGPPAQKLGRLIRGNLATDLSDMNKDNVNGSKILGGLAYFENIAQDLAALDPAKALERLERDDPFGTRTFDSELLQHETDLGRVLAIDEIRQLFPCPASERRITLPDARMEQKARDFRDGRRGTFLFFQHLRKAGGTNFCSLAEKNLPKSAYPPYYCMPDMGWSGNKNAGYLHSWSNEEIITRMENSGYRIAGNEWENFDVKRHFDLPAVFATSFRKPLDRALSQFRFECIEDRGCRIKDVHKWWDKRTDLWNVYTNTFADGSTRQHLRGNYSNERRDLMAKAINTLSKFNIVLSMEWLAYAGPQVRSILGFVNVSELTTRVRPHITQAKRDDGQDKNNLGSASIAKASWVPKEYLDAKQYKKMSEDLALDEVLTDVARRMFLERLVCEDAGGDISTTLQ